MLANTKLSAISDANTEISRTMQFTAFSDGQGKEEEQNILHKIINYMSFVL